MKIAKRWKMVVFSLALVLTLCAGNVLSEAAQKKVVGFYRSDFVSGIAETGTTIIQTCAGYSSSGAISDSVRERFYGALQTNDVVLIHTHGAPGLFTLSSKTTVTAKQLQNLSNLVSNAKLVYISACKTGASSDTDGTMGTVLVQKNSNPSNCAVVAFTENISASTTSNGIHFFNQRVISYMANGYQLSNAITKAKVDTYNEYGSYYGADSCVFYGNGGLKL